MATLKALAAAIQSGAQAALNHAILIYGPPKTGKTRLVATAAKIPEVTKIWWFDLENGAETLLHMGLTDDELDKIEYIKVTDTREAPWACETLLKTICTSRGAWISQATGRVVDAKARKEGDIFFKLSDCKNSELVVVDSGTQLGLSAMNAAIYGQPHSYKLQLDDYGLAGKWLGDIMSVMQQATHTNFVLITHETMVEDNDKKIKFFPMCGTAKFSLSMAKFFGTVVYTHMKMKKHCAGSSTSFSNDKITGSRLNIAMETSELSMHALLIDGGIIPKKKAGV